MKTKNIFKTLVLAAVLVSACGKNEIADDFKGYALPVTINVSRQGDEPATRATYNESTKKLSFTAGDKLFVTGNHAEAGVFAGTLDYDAVSGKFSGTVTTKNEYTGTIDALMASAYAVLLPAGYESYGFNSIVGNGYEATIRHYLHKAFALTKAAAVEQFSVERALSYSSGFALAPMNAILNFTINGLGASTEVDVSFSYPNYPDPTVISGKVTTDGDGTATFAIGIIYDNNLKDCTLTVGGLPITLTSSSKMVEAGHIYNISRSVKKVIWNSSKVAGIDINEYPGDNSFESEGITVAAFGDSGANFTDSKMSFGGSDSYFTFTSSVGNIKKIEINYTGDVFGYEEEPVGWSLGVGTFTWEGDSATSVTLPSSGYASIEGITSIVFTLQ